jgi:hypothetical protein
LTDTLHVIGGVVLQLGLAMILRRKVTDWLSWTIVLIL